MVLPNKSTRRPLVELLERRDVPTILGNPVFPADNPWNQLVTHAPVAANSATLVSSIGRDVNIHADFGSGTWDGSKIGIPYNVVPGTQPKLTVVIDAYPDESDRVPVPIPANAVLEGDPLSSSANDGDRHLLVYDKDHNILYELFNAHRPSETGDGKWHADSEAVWDLSKNSFRPAGWTSADAAGLPILPGLVRADEVFVDHKIDHPIRFTVPASDSAYLFPASHHAGDSDSSLPRMGERFRLRASFDISGFSAANQVILQAMKDYGLIVADNGSGWYISGAPDPRWNNDDLHALDVLHGTDFQALDLTPRVTSLSVTSGPSGGGTQVTLHGVNFSGGAGETRVTFGGKTATGLVINSDSSITVTAPTGSAGQTVDVRVVSPYGSSATGAADHFTWTSTTHPGSLQFAVANTFVNEKASSVTITVTRSGGSDGAVSVRCGTVSGGTATANADYTPVTTTLTFAAGVTSRSFTIPLRDDYLVEPRETIALALASPTGAATIGARRTATVTIVNDDPSQGTLIFGTGTYSVNEGGDVTITVVRLGGSTGAVSVHFATVNGTARAGSDFRAASGTLSFAAGETRKSFTIHTLADTLAEGNETLTLLLSDVAGGAALGARKQAVVTILD